MYINLGVAAVVGANGPDALGSDVGRRPQAQTWRAVGSPRARDRRRGGLGGAAATTTTTTTTTTTNNNNNNNSQDGLRNRAEPAEPNRAEPFNACYY